MADTAFIQNPDRHIDLPKLGRVCRLGLATRGNTSLDPQVVLEAIDRGINYLNWCGHPDGLQQAIRQLGPRRSEVCVAVQMSARSADEAHRELDWFLNELKTDYIDVVTYYYVEHQSQWHRIHTGGGAAEVLEAARAEGRIRAIGMTSHQRPLAAESATSGRLDLLMIRYNAAHRKAEEQIFPVTQARGIPVVAFTCLRWGALLKSTPDDPDDFIVPPATEWYRFVLCHPAVSVALIAPDGTDELWQNLTLLDDWRGFYAEEYAALMAHGDRVYRHAGSFP